MWGGYELGLENTITKTEHWRKLKDLEMHANKAERMGTRSYQKEEKNKNRTFLQFDTPVNESSDKQH